MEELNNSKFKVDNLQDFETPYQNQMNVVDCCIICAEKLTENPKSSTKSSLNEQLNVIFFLNHFFKQPLQRFELQTLLKTHGNPKEWMWFCSKCLSHVEKGRQLHLQLTKCQKKLNILRKLVKINVSRSLEKIPPSDNANANENLYQAVRESLRKSTTAADITFSEKLDIKLENEFESDEYTLETTGDFAKPEFPFQFGDDNEIETEFEIQPDMLVDQVWKLESDETKNGIDKRLRSKPRLRREIKGKQLQSGDGNTCDSSDNQEKDASFQYSEVDSNCSSSDSDFESDQDWSENPDDNDKLKYQSNRLKNNCASQPNKIKRVRNPNHPKYLAKRTCPICGHVLDRPAKMRIHLNTKHEKKLLFFCEIETCKKGFTSKDYLRLHKKVHMTPEERERFCKKTTKPDIKPKQVKEKKKKEKPTEFKCPSCDKVFKKECRMKEHLDNIHIKPTGGYHCEICQKTFAWRGTYRNHLKFHSNGDVLIKRFKCSFEPCTAAFVSRRDRRVHEGVHTGAKNYLCSLCGTSYRHRWTFDNHNRVRHPETQGDVQKFICEICGKEFTLRKNLQQHLKSKSHGGQGFRRHDKQNDVSSISFYTSDAVTSQIETNAPNNTTHHNMVSDGLNTVTHPQPQPFFNQSHFALPIFHHM